VFPLYAQAYQDGEPRRLRHWQRLEQTLAQAIQTQRATVLQALADPAVGRTLLYITRWLENGPFTSTGAQHPAAKWLRKRVAKLAEQLKSTPRHTPDPATQHRLRILSKRLRYSIESLRALLPKKRAGRWLHTAIQYQTRIGLERDQQQAVQIAQRLQAADGITEFLRGAAFGSSANQAHDTQPQ
jgi:CHAD domain-containing protein